MTVDKVFGNTIALLEKSLDLRSRNHDLIVGNITNADTPGYRAFDMQVDEALQRGPNAAALDLRRCRDGHLAAPPTRDGVLLKECPANPFDLRKDGNTVDVDREMHRLAENGLMYNTSAQMIARKFQGLLGAIQGEVR